MSNLDIHYSSAKTTGKNEWSTPVELFNILDSYYQFVVDAAADETNHLCHLWIGPGGIQDNALRVGWSVTINTTAWCNPPYSLAKEFLAKAAFEAEFNNVRSVLLVGARTDTKYFHETIWPNATDIIFLKGRLKFGGAKHAAPFPSMLVIFEPGKRVNEFPNVWTWDWKKESYPVGAMNEV